MTGNGKAYSRGAGCWIATGGVTTIAIHRLLVGGSADMQRLGARLSDQLSYPETEDENRHQGSYSACSSAEGLDEVNAANDLFVLFLNDGKSGLAEKKLIRFVLGESATVDHQANKRSHANAPDYCHYVKCIHGVPQ
ncbi:MAG: hypothetical protein WBY53_07990 [Acidobacteriaceae bacterium]